MAKKGSMPVYATVDDYIADQTETAQVYLKKIRAIIHDVVPDCEEVFTYKVPSFTLVPGGTRDHQIMMAAYAKFIGFYPFDATMSAFKSELKGFKQGTGSVQFPLNKPLPEDIIRRMIAFRRDEVLSSLR